MKNKLSILKNAQIAPGSVTISNVSNTLLSIEHSPRESRHASSSAFFKQREEERNLKRNERIKTYRALLDEVYPAETSDGLRNTILELLDNYAVNKLSLSQLITLNEYVDKLQAIKTDRLEINMHTCNTMG